MNLLLPNSSRKKITHTHTHTHTHVSVTDRGLISAETSDRDLADINNNADDADDDDDDAAAAADDDTLDVDVAGDVTLV